MKKISGKEIEKEYKNGEIHYRRGWSKWNEAQRGRGTAGGSQKQRTGGETQTDRITSIAMRGVK